MHNVSIAEARASGIKSIVIPSFTVLDLQKFIQDSCLADKYTLSSQGNICDTKQIYVELEKLLSPNLTFNELTSLLVASSIAFLIERPYYYFNCNNLLRKSFQYLDTLNPVHLHLVTKCLVKNFKILSANNFKQQLLKICHHICENSSTGHAIMLCLLWAMLYEIAEIKVKMYRLHELSQLSKTLEIIDKKIFTQEGNAVETLNLVKIVNFLINVIVFAPNEEISHAGYSKYYCYTLRDLKDLNKWGYSVLAAVNTTLNKQKKNWKLCMLIKELLKVGICAMTDMKIKDLKQDLKYSQ